MNMMPFFTAYIPKHKTINSKQDHNPDLIDPPVPSVPGFSNDSRYVYSDFYACVSGDGNYNETNDIQMRLVGTETGNTGNKAEDLAAKSLFGPVQGDHVSETRVNEPYETLSLFPVNDVSVPDNGNVDRYNREQVDKSMVLKNGIYSRETDEQWEDTVRIPCPAPGAWSKVELLLPADTPLPVPAGRWRRMEDGRILTTYTPMELELAVVAASASDYTAPVPQQGSSAPTPGL